MMFFIKIAGLLLLLLLIPVHVFADDTATAYDLEQQASKGDVNALLKLKQGAESGNAAYESAYGYYFGDGIYLTLQKIYPMDAPQDVVEKNRVQAVFWYKKAAEQGNIDGERLLADYYEEGHGGLKKDLNQALMLYTKSAASGDVQAESDLGSFYGRHGDQKKALEWLTKAADQSKPGDSVFIYLADKYYIGDKNYNKIIVTALYILANDYQDVNNPSSGFYLSKAKIKIAEKLEQRMSKIGVSAAIDEYLKSVHKSK